MQYSALIIQDLIWVII